MKTHTIKLAFKGIAVVLALAAPGIGWATDHILSLTGITTSVCPSPGVSQDQAGVVNGTSGAVTTPLILSGLQGSDSNSSNCTPGNLNNSVSLTGLLALETASVKRCKPGTNGQLEWLDQGPTIIGANGTLNGSAEGVAYQVVVPVGSVSIQNVSGSCDGQLNADNYTVTRGPTTITNTTTTTTLATASFIIPFPNTVPEPGTLALIGLGLAGLGWVGAKRARKARAKSV